MRKINWKSVGLIILVMAAVSIIGESFTDIGTWYEQLAKPSFQPPNWIFAPMWTLLYIFVGISLYLLSESDLANKSGLLTLFGINLHLNVLWSFFYFSQKNPPLALIDLVLLWVTLIIIVIKAWKIQRTVAWLSLPYLLWVSFAGILNLFTILLN